MLELQPEVLVLGGAVRVSYAMQRGPKTPIIAIDLEGSRTQRIGPESVPGREETSRASLDMPEMAGKLVELMKEVVPEVSRCAILSDERFGRAQIEATERAARARACSRAARYRRSARG